MTENINFEDLGFKSSYDSVYISTLDECSIKIIINFEKTISKTVFLKSQSEAENINNVSVKAIFEDENFISEVVRLFSSYYNIDRFMRSFCDIHFMDISSSFVSDKRRYALLLKSFFKV